MMEMLVVSGISKGERSKMSGYEKERLWKRNGEDFFVDHCFEIELLDFE